MAAILGLILGALIGIVVHPDIPIAVSYTHLTLPTNVP